jgi:glycosyltransferase involved in cell wall biosynthesis
MNWIPNQEGIRWFIENVWNKIHKEFPSLKYYIAGREMPEWLTKSNYPGVVVAGEVEDALRFMHQHSVMIVPLFSGSGIRIKIIEGMAAGKAIISTSIGAEGIHYSENENILIADESDAFCEAVKTCIANREFCRSLGANARKLIENEYQRKDIIRNLIGFYHKLGA